MAGPNTLLGYGCRLPWLLSEWAEKHRNHSIRPSEKLLLNLFSCLFSVDLSGTKKKEAEIARGVAS